MTRKSQASTTAHRQRGIQERQAGNANKRSGDSGAMQAGERTYPEPPFPKQHQRKPGSEAKLDPEPMFEAPFFPVPYDRLPSRPSIRMLTAGGSMAIAVAARGQGEGASSSIVSRKR